MKHGEKLILIKKEKKTQNISKQHQNKTKNYVYGMLDTVLE